MSIIREYDEYDQVCIVHMNMNSFCLFPNKIWISRACRRERVERCARTNKIEKAKFGRNKEN